MFYINTSKYSENIKKNINLKKKNKIIFLKKHFKTQKQIFQNLLPSSNDRC
jgi:hypothetical protein